MRRILFIALMLGVDCALWAQSSLLHNGQQETARERVNARLTTEGGLSSITIDGDTTRMNWTVEPTGQQYPWIGPQYQWGLGTLRVDGQPADWHVADRVEWTKDGSSVAEFTVGGGLALTVSRKVDGKDFIESYTFRNTGSKPLSLTEIEVNTPFNDNYPDAKTCINRRCHAHIWAAGTASYVCALRMGAYAPHLGLMLTSGCLEGYSIKERDGKKGSSNTRGIICLCPAATQLAPGATYSFSWRLFTHLGRPDFFDQLLARGGVQVTAQRYVGEMGEKLSYTVRTAQGSETKSYRIAATGDIRVPISWQGGETYLELLGVSNFRKFIARRADFLLTHQQYNAPGDKRDGAFLPYNNATNEQYRNWLMERNWSDGNEGRERMGIGIFLTYFYQQQKSKKVLNALKRYARFVRTQLQDEDFRTWSDADRASSRISSGTQRRRIYNYPWVAHFYCQMYEVCREQKYLQWAYGTLRACYRNGGYNFYAIDVPICQSITQLRGAGMTAEADSLLGDYRKAAANYIKNGTNYPKFEVNFEQSIVAPSVNFLCEMYLVTKERQYLDAARQLMPVVEAFGFAQPSSHLSDIGLRHWDGHWFGLPKQWGDTMPHYWSCITADCFANYALCTGDDTYRQRAQNILRGNLSLFTEDGRGGAAFLYPLRVNGQPAHGLNPLANDQDFALMFYLKWIRLKQ